MEILSVEAMYAADKFAASHGTPSLILMENAGRAICDEIVRRWQPCAVLVMCGPGNNGGDGFVVARRLKELGWDVTVGLLGERESYKGDAADNAARWDGPCVPLIPEMLGDCDLVIDALFGAGLSRPLDGKAHRIVSDLRSRRVPVVAVDVPSGLSGDLGKPLSGLCVRATLTVTFFRKKPAHVLMPGRMICGDVVVADIGIPPAALTAAPQATFENAPELWKKSFPKLDPMGHKYSRGHAVVISGPVYTTGAARLAARGALRAGAGLVSVASPAEAAAINAAHLTAIMVKPFRDGAALKHMLLDKRYNAVAVGPGCGVNEETRALADIVLESGAAAVLDADALSVFRDNPAHLFRKLKTTAVLTPHTGEFERIFPGMLTGASSRIAAVRDAAALAGAVVLLKGPDTAVAAPDGRVAIATNAPPDLATAGAGDVLCGMITGLMAQGMPAFEAACAGVWLHGEAANAFGAGLIAEDLPEMLPDVLHRLRSDL